MLKKPTKLRIPYRILFCLFSLLCLSGQALYAAHDYINALYLTTYFYGAQRCGSTSSWCHAACHVKDGQTVSLDLTGGWHDCGDHVTFGQTAPYSAGVLLEGYLLKPASYKDNYSQANSAGSPNGIPDILDEVKVMTDLLIKCTTGGRFYYQKGNGDYDHKHMCEPAYYSTTYNVIDGGEKDGGRPMSYVTSGGSNVCGDAAAALALMAIAYAPYDSTYATTCFTKAKEVFAIGDTSPGTVSGGGYYGAANYQDDMAWGGSTIYRASVARGAAENTYLTKATSYISGGQGAGSWPLCYDHTEFLAHYNIYKINGSAASLTWMTNELTYYKGKMVTCGTGSYAWVTGWGSLRYAANMAFGAALLHSINAVAADYTFLKNNVDFILGTHGDVAGSPNCPAGRSFVVGYTNPDNVGAGSVAHPHHRAAFGKTSSADTQWQTENTTPGSIPYAYVLKGALVGGPQASCSNYNDRIDDYTANEVGIDYNAGLVGAIAYIISISNPSTPTFTFTPNLSHTKTRTPTITPTWTASPVPPPTNKLNLEVLSSSSSNACTTQTFAFEYKVTNWETTVVNTSNLAIKVWVDTADTIAGSIYNARKYNSSGVDQGTVTAAVAEGAGLSCGGATKSAVITITSTDIPENGGYLVIQGALNRAGYQTPFDADCNDYTKLLAAWTTYQNNNTQTLWQGTNLVCEYLSASTQDSSTGLHPCTGGNGCTPPGSITPTRTVTRTATRTFTRTNTPVITYTRTATRTATRTSTRTATPVITYTSTASATATYTRTWTRTATATATRTNTTVITYTRTATPSATRTVTPVITFTRTATRSVTSTATGTNTPVITFTQTATRTITPTNTQPASATYTRTPPPTSTVTRTWSATPSATPSPTYTRTRTPSFTRTATTTGTGTATPTATRTATGTFTLTYTRTFTLTPSFTRTATPSRTQTWTRTGTPTTTGTRTATPTGTISPTHSVSPTITETMTGTPPTNTVTPTITGTYTISPSFTITRTSTPTITETATDTDTATETYTPTETKTSTGTVTGTATTTGTRTVTEVPTATNTSTDLPTGTQTPADTAMPTYTETEVIVTNTPVDSPVPTSSATASVSQTIINTITPTSSVVPTSTSSVVPTATNTSENTPMDTPVNTPVDTATLTAVPSNTNTPAPTLTNTLPPTAVPTVSFTLTLTRTATFTPVPTGTFTRTQVPAITPTPTGTPTVQPDRQEITNLLAFPNPFNASVTSDLYVGFTAARNDSDSITMKLYTPALRLVRVITYSGAEAQAAFVTLRFRCGSSELSGLSGGVYYYVLEAGKAGQTARSKVEKIIIMKQQ